MQEAFQFRFLHVFSAFYMTDNALVRTSLLRLYLSDYRIQRKRQDNQHDDDGDGTAEEVGDQSAPVSYTHLDVYKRQMLYYIMCYWTR